MTQKVSIITINRNNSIGLEKTILSVINQSYDNFEYIIIDGKSEDSSVDIIKKYSKYITYYVSERDNGIYDAMNKGINMASGEWINFMNSGDMFYDNDVLATVFGKENTKILEYSDVIYGDIVQTIPNLEFLSIPDSIDTMPVTKPFGHQSSFIRLSVHKKYEFNLKYRICADYDFFLKLYNKGYKFKYMNIIISRFDSIDSLSTNDSKLSVIEECSIKNISSKKEIYKQILKRKIEKTRYRLFNFLCKYNSFLLNKKIDRMKKKPNIGWIEIKK